MSALRILVPVKRVIDYAVRLPFSNLVQLIALPIPDLKALFHSSPLPARKSEGSQPRTRWSDAAWSRGWVAGGSERDEGGIEREGVQGNANGENKVKPRVNKAQTAIETAGVKHSMNPFDELSIEESVRIREKKSYAGGVEEIIALSIGPPKSVDILRTAMAMGADRSIFVEVKDGEEVEPLAVGKIIRRLVEKEVCRLSLFPGLVDGRNGGFRGEK
jgi:hypothetical protein